ncbi:MAG: hypothetical protein V4450_16195 [Bacteroidota bacterium]
MHKLKELQTILKLVFGIVPIVAGLDKFTNLLTYWPDYMAGNLRDILPIDVLLFMKIVGIIEIIAGVLVLIRPLIGAYIVMLWLIALAFQLIFGAHHFDTAVRDLVMAAGAYALVAITLMLQQKTTGDVKQARFQKKEFN